MSPNFRPRFMSAAHVPSSTERLMNPFYHSQVRLPPYRARYSQRFHPYPRVPSSSAPGLAQDIGVFDFEWDEFLEMVDAFQRLEIDDVPRSNHAYAFPNPEVREGPVTPQDNIDRCTACSNVINVSSVETDIIDAPRGQSDMIRVSEDDSKDDNEGTLEVILIFLLPAIWLIYVFYSLIYLDGKCCFPCVPRGSLGAPVFDKWGRLTEPRVTPAHGRSRFLMLRKIEDQQSIWKPGLKKT